MKFASRVAGFIGSSFAKRPRLGITVAIAVLAPLLLWGQSTQWTFSGSTASVTGVNVGIGTTSPATNLSVVGNGAFTGILGVGTANPAWNLDVQGNTNNPFGMNIRNYNANGNASNVINFGNDGSNIAALINESGGSTSLGGGYSLNLLTYTSSPIAFYTNGTSNQRMIITSAGNVGIGTTSPVTTLHVNGASVIGSSSSGGTNVSLNAGGPASTRNISIYYNQSNETGYLQVGYGGVSYNPLALNPSGGNVGIGTTDPQYPLSVNGIVQAKEVLVNTGWSDYVFDPKYRLRPLSEVASYIKTNGHLPDIPSAKEVEAKGVSLGDMQSKLLAKVEELTLHMIEAERENRELRERIARLEAARH
jgi:hypothetical protein